MLPAAEELQGKVEEFNDLVHDADQLEEPPEETMEEFAGINKAVRRPVADSSYEDPEKKGNSDKATSYDGAHKPWPRVVTGANTGIGFQVIRALACHGCSVIMACRDKD